MAMTAESLRQPIRYEIDIGAGLIQQPLRTQLMKGDKDANVIVVALKDKGTPVTLDGVAVSGSFIRPGDGAEVLLEGEASGS